MGVAGVGIILRNDQGVVLFAASRKEVWDFSVDDIEALAALRGLQMILQLGYPSLQLEGDSLTVIEAIMSHEPNFMIQGPLIMEINRLLRFFQHYDVVHVGRQSNEAAHLLAQHSKQVADMAQWMHSYPDLISNRVLSDRDVLNMCL